MDEIKKFCKEYINLVSDDLRHEIFNMICLYVKPCDIDSSNADGSRIREDKIPDECYIKMHKMLETWLTS